VKVLAGILAALIVLIQYPLWLGKGGWVHAWEAEGKLAAQLDKNQQLELRNASLTGEVNDLKHGTDAIEERARYELGMIKKDEVFYQIVRDRQGN
jgi:cell division protein FtsB